MNTKSIFVVGLLSIGFLFGVTSCKKKGCTDDTATNYNSSAEVDDGSCQYATPTASATAPGGYTPNYTGTFAALIGIKTISTTSTPIGPIDTEIGTAVAVFSEDGGANFMSAGTVDANSNNLTAQSNDSYVYVPGTSNPNGISFGSTVDWNGTGAAWPTFNASTSQGFSTVAEISSGDVDLSTSYTASCPSVLNADSVYFGVYGPDGTAFVIVAGGTSSHTFNAADISGLGSGQGYVQIVGINYDPQTIGGRSYWLLNETVRTKSVSLN